MKEFMVRCVVVLVLPFAVLVFFWKVTLRVGSILFEGFEEIIQENFK